MTEAQTKKPQTTVQGVIRKVTPWQSGKGCFLALHGDSSDYYMFCKHLPNEGDNVTLTVTEGTGNFSDRLQITKLEPAKRTLEEIKQAKKEADEIVQQSTMAGDRFYFKREDLIIKQTCIKAAAEVIGHCVERSKTPALKGLTDAVIDMADRFYCYVTEQEEAPRTEKEPADEPEEGETNASNN